MWFEPLTSALLNRLTRPRPQRRDAGLLLGMRTEPPHSTVLWPDRQRTQHAVCIGKTGTGKTYLLERLALALAERGQGFAFFDFHGDASRSLISRLLQLPHHQDQLVVLDPSHPSRSPGLNILAAEATDADRFRKVSELSAILRQRWGVDAFGARTEELLRNSLYTLAASRRTLGDLPRLLSQTTFRRQLTEALDHPDIASYWRDRFEPLSDAMKASFREPLLNKVTAFLTEPAVRHLLGQVESTIDMAAIMAQQQWLLIRLPKGRLGEHAHTLGNLLFAQLQFSAFAREHLPPSRRHPFTILCDEVQNLAENDLTTLLTEGRKFGIAVLTANQFWEQLPRELRACLLSAAAHICFRVSHADAQALASELSPTHRTRLLTDLTTLPQGQAVARIGTAPVVKFQVPSLPSIQPANDDTLTRVVTPVTRLRLEIERDLRLQLQDNAIVADHPPATATGREGQHGW